VPPRRRRDPTGPARADLDELARALGHSFSDPTVLHQALCHPSAPVVGGGRGYERLEFLGDRVLGLVVAELLYRRFPDAPEGELARRQTALVRGETLAEIARSLGLGRHLVLSRGEADAGGRDNPGILADALEAVMAAVYLDGGVAAAEAVIGRLLGERVAGNAPRDPKTALQEWLQARGGALPRYETVSSAGPDHAPAFTVRVATEDGVEATATGRSKRAAERAAAAGLLRRLAGGSGA